MNDDPAAFEQSRQRLQGIAYRMLGSVADAEDVVQEAWLRWSETTQELVNGEAWLVTVTTRLSIDRLRTAQVRRESYVGLWLPEPMLNPSPATPDEALERANDVSMAFLMLLERLTPEARAAFLLREVFDTDYRDVASAIGKSEAACRQLVRRAQLQLQEARPRRVVPKEVHLHLLRSFSQAMAHGDFALLHAMLAEDAQLLGDGGGKVPSLGKPLLGGRRIAQLFYATHLRFGALIRVELAVLNEQWALLRFVDGALESAQSYETDGTRITQIHVQRNPEKLVSLISALAAR